MSFMPVPFPILVPHPQGIEYGPLTYPGPHPQGGHSSPSCTSLIVTIGGVLLIILLLLIGGPPLVTLILNLLKKQGPLPLAQALPKELRAQPCPAMGVTRQSRALPTRAFPQV